MRIEVREESTLGYFAIRFRYDANTVIDVKRIRGSRWNPGDKTWHVPISERLAVQRFVAKWDGAQAVKEIQEIQEPYVPLDQIYPTCTKTQPWKHQLDAFRFIWHREASLLHLTMGAGKSRVITDYVCNKPGVRQVLIACPLSVVDVWPAQFERHAGKPVLCVPLGSNAGSVEQKMIQGTHALTEGKVRRTCPVVVVVNYDSIWRDPFADWALNVEWDLVVWDEVQRVKAAGSKVSRFAYRLAGVALKRIGLSGTPFPHSPKDCYGVMRALDASILGTSASRFMDRYAIMGGYGSYQVKAWINQDELREKIDRIRFHCEPEGYDLPEAVHSDIVLQLPAKAQKVYTQLERAFYAQVENGEITVANAGVAAIRLQTLTSGFIMLDEEVSNGYTSTGSQETSRVYDEKERRILAQDDMQPMRQDHLEAAQGLQGSAVVSGVLRQGQGQTLHVLSGMQQTSDRKEYNGVLSNTLEDSRSQKDANMHSRGMQETSTRTTTVQHASASFTLSRGSRACGNGEEATREECTRRIHNGAGISHADDRGEACVRAQVDNGSDDWATSSQIRTSPSQKRHKERQQSGESGIMGEASTSGEAIRRPDSVDDSDVSRANTTGPRIREMHTIKQDALQDYLEDLPADEPVVVFCRFRHDLDAIHAATRAVGRTSSELSGRTKTLQDWQEGTTTVLAAQLRAGSLGVDLTRAAYVVYYSYTYALEEYEQSLARVRRPGQTRTCFYTHLVVKGTIDFKIRQALINRKRVLEALLER